MFSKSELNLLREIIARYLDTYTQSEKEELKEFLKPIYEIDNKIKKSIDK